MIEINKNVFCLYLTFKDFLKVCCVETPLTLQITSQMEPKIAQHIVLPFKSISDAFSRVSTKLDISQLNYH